MKSLSPVKSHSSQKPHDSRPWIVLSVLIVTGSSAVGFYRDAATPQQRHAIRHGIRTAARSSHAGMCAGLKVFITLRKLVTR